MSSVSLTNDFIEQVSAATDILSVVSGYVPLKRKGNRYWGCCPFHQEKTASFSVKPTEGFFYCFGCHVGGNAFKFLSMVENVNYYEAVRIQAERLNIPLPVREKTPQEIARENHLNDLRKLHEMATNFFHNCLTKTSYGNEGLAYLHQRGITDEIISDFKLGFAPDAWDKLKNAFMKREIPEAMLTESGLVVKRNDGDNSYSYDRFRKRVMIPISDERGRVVAFGGRIVGDGEPKYLNSPETAIFNKRKLLFGLDKAQKEIQKAGFALVVEGYMDVISVYAAGFRNVVASLGTAFTQEQCRSIMRRGAALYFCYDSDTAGQKATVRGLAIAKSTGAVVKVVTIPDGKDPDEYIRKHGVEAFRRVVDGAIPMMDFYMKYVADRVDVNTLEGKLQGKNELSPLLNSIREPSEQIMYISKIARLLGISEAEIRGRMRAGNVPSSGEGQLINQEYASVSNIQQREKAKYVMDDKTKRSWRVMVRTAWKEPSMIDHMLSVVPLEFLPDWVREILEAIGDAASEGVLPTPEMVMPKVSEEAFEELSLALVKELGQSLDVMYDACCRDLRLSYLGQLKERVRQQTMQSTDKDLRKSGLFEIRRIEKEMEELKLKDSSFDIKKG